MTVRDALAGARRDLGPDALVLSTRMVSVGGWRGWMGAREVEVTIAAARDVSEDRPAAQPFRQAPQRSSPSGQVVARLLATGVDQELAEAVAAALPSPQRRGASTAALRAALAGRLRPIATDEDDADPQVQVFLGPPGGGKTTTIAKIAAQARARKGKRLGLVAADAFRIGAIDQLRRYAEVIGTPFGVIRTPDELGRMLDKGSRTPVLVDTAGRSAREPGTCELFSLVAGRPGVRTHLVLPASTPFGAAERILDAYGDRRPDRVVITKIDESDSIGPLVRLCRQRSLPVSYIGTGQRIPEDLDRATAPYLAACLLGDCAVAEGRPA